MNKFNERYIRTLGKLYNCCERHQSRTKQMERYMMFMDLKIQ